jgi:hypothetical protein
MSSLTPGFVYSEALTATKLSYIVDCFTVIQSLNLAVDQDPLGTDADSTGDWTSGCVQVPMKQDLRPVYPAGWAPVNGTNWMSAFAYSETKDGVTENVSMLVKNGSVYCLAFRGTVNMANVRQDAQAALEAAGPNNSSKFNYINNGAPGPIGTPKVHSGFRASLETMAAGSPSLESTQSLTDLINLIPDGADVIVTGHSLGAGQATLCAAALAAGGFPGVTAKFNLKVYAIAQPHPGNAAFQANYQYSFGTGDSTMAYCVDNSLDIIPKLPDDYDRAYVYVGSLIEMTGTAVAFTPISNPLMPSTPYAFYTTASGDSPAILDTSFFKSLSDKVERLGVIERLWQHWPFVYAAMLQTKYGG